MRLTTRGQGRAEQAVQAGLVPSILEKMGRMKSLVWKLREILLLVPLLSVLWCTPKLTTEQLDNFISPIGMSLPIVGS